MPAIKVEGENPHDPSHYEMPSSIVQRYHEFMADSCCTHMCQGPNPQMARYVYGLIFLVTNLLAWMVRDYGHNALSELDLVRLVDVFSVRYNGVVRPLALMASLFSNGFGIAIATVNSDLKGCQGVHDCLGTEGVLRVSLGCFIFYFTMFLTTVGSTKMYEPRDSWHSGWWPLKSLIWIITMVVPFFIPSAFIQFYGEVARFGAGIFLIIQLISVINFITWWNEYWLSEENADLCGIPVVAMSTMAYAASLTGIILMYIWYAPKVSCTLNIFFITLTLILLQVMTSISLHSKVNAGLMTAGLMGLYVVFLCWSAIRSEPVTEKCNTMPQGTGRGDWITIVSFIIGLLAIVMATFSTGIDSKSFQFRKDEVESDDDVPYGYGFFHFVFSMGAMYFGMLFIGWNLHQTMQKWSIDVGWASTWVKIVNEWLAAGLYVWTLIAPIVWKNRTNGRSASNV